MIEFIDEKGMIEPIGGDFDSEIAITAFSDHTYGELVSRSGAKKLTSIEGCIGLDVRAYERGGKRIIVYKSPIGAPAAAAAMEEVMACGVKKVVAFGICGSLIEAPNHTFMVPTRAYRDEGTSLHYMPPSDYIELNNSGIVEKSLKTGGIKTLTGGAWTTDGFYRETRTRAEKMKANGCIAVDMECSALQAVANFRGKQFYTFFITADSLAGEKWEPNDILDLKVTDSTTVAAVAAMHLAEELLEELL